MIEWRKYDKNDRNIEIYVPHLVTDGREIMMAAHVYRGSGNGYDWHLYFEEEGTGWVSLVTHYAPINLPGEEEA